MKFQRDDLLTMIIDKKSLPEKDIHLVEFGEWQVIKGSLKERDVIFRHNGKFYRTEHTVEDGWTVNDYIWDKEVECPEVVKVEVENTKHEWKTV